MEMGIAGAMHNSVVQNAASLITATKTFGGTTALSKVTIHLVPGEVLALLGENGAGKSTCVKLLAGVYQPDEGRVEIDGKAISFQDASIAAVCIALGCMLVTENTSDFPMPELQLYPLSQKAA